LTLFDDALATAEEFNHPTWGPSILAGCLGETGYAAVVMDAEGTVQWTKSSADLPWQYPPAVLPRLTKYQPASPVMDASGNLYIQYAQIPQLWDDPGAGPRPGVEILRPTFTGIETLVPSDLEWAALVQGEGAGQDDFWDQALFAPATLDGLRDDGLYRIRMATSEEADPISLSFVWAGGVYGMDLGPRQWLLWAKDNPVTVGANANSIWGQVSVQGSEVTVIYCGTQSMLSLTTCSFGIDNGMTLLELVGSIGSDGNATVINPTYPEVWGVVKFVSGQPVRVDRPDDTRCQYADGSPILDDPWC
jgi:hypothetical protein